MEYIDQNFKLLLKNHDIKILNKHSGVIYGIWDDFRIAYLNPAWFEFAEENNGEPEISEKWDLGRSIMDCVSGDVKEHYQSMYKKCLDQNEVWEHEYECSSVEIYRKYHQVVYPLIDQQGLLIVNTLVNEHPHDPISHQEPDDAKPSSYLDQNGMITQCAYCRMVKNYEKPERWDWVPVWVEKCPTNTSHTFCPTCFSHYFHAPS